MAALPAALAEGVEAVEPVVQAEERRQVPLVMVVDDSVTMRKVTGRVLERHNFEVVTARDGIDAIERMDERVPDLMLLDIEMPRMDGYELATHMKAEARLRGVPIVMITSRTGEKHRQRAFEIGVERYLGKPYQEHELVHNVYELLGAEVFLYFDVDGNPVTARVEPDTKIRPGKSMTFTFDTKKIHIFDKETELTIAN